MNLGLAIRLARKKKGISQSELAVRAGVGLATVQNLECSRANPALSTVMALLKVLRIELRLEPETATLDWAVLAQLGCPLMTKTMTKGASGWAPTRALLLEQVHTIQPQELKRREARAVAAWLHALRDHYPSLWPHVPVMTRAWTQNQIVSPKLRRIALNHLAEFL